MLANEGADAVNQQVCDAESVDIAMQSGVNYPCGPLSWADRIGIDVVVNTLQNLLFIYGENRYRISPLLSRKMFSGTTFFKPV
jgi:3-hydroxybutyryl-CoA dehydrogenase